MEGHCFYWLDVQEQQQMGAAEAPLRRSSVHTHSNVCMNWLRW